MGSSPACVAGGLVRSLAGTLWQRSPVVISDCTMQLMVWCLDGFQLCCAPGSSQMAVWSWTTAVAFRGRIMV